MLARAQYAVELALARVRSGSVAYQRHEEEHAGSSEGIGIALTRYADVHAFLVSAALFWKTLKRLQEILAVPEIGQVRATHAETIEATLHARHHAEHVQERIKEGRGPGYGQEMTAETFRSALGHFEGETVIRYGDERFDLDELAAAIRETGEELAPTVRKAAEITVTVKQGLPPEQPSERPAED